MTYYRVARIVNTFGIRGQLKLIADTDFPEERFASGKTLYSEGFEFPTAS